MRKIFTVIFCLPFVLFPQSLLKKKSVLFLGNSYTYVNNLPLLVYNIALANGDTLIYDSNTIGGYSFNNHFNDATSLSKINAAKWNYVVLQGQSQEPSFPPAQVNAQTLPYALKLDSAIKQNFACTNTVFYETWGRKNGDASNCGNYPPLCTYAGMQNRLKQSYKQFADTTNSIMSPAGDAFRRSIALNPLLELYNADESHPSAEGSFLVASVFYEVLFQKSVLTNTYNPGIAVSTAAFLQQVAHATVNDSLMVWNIGKNLPWADFGINPLSAVAYQFQSASFNLANAWYFGDGATSTAANPSHTYAVAGTYTVSHVVKNGCSKDSVSKVLSGVVTSIGENLIPSSQLTVYPNPCNNKLYISGGINQFKNNGSMLEIRNALGQVLYKSEFTELVDVEALKNGVYFISISNQLTTINTRFIKSD